MNLTTEAKVSALHHVSQLEHMFNALFEQSTFTILKSGAEEPLYAPASASHALNVIHSTRDYISSALHEISHWCIAGEARRKLMDYGYWYEPDGRTTEQQRLFESVEVKPQALEWLFSKACGQVFRLSVDNVNQPDLKPSEHFKQAVYHQAVCYLREGLPDRAAAFMAGLLSCFGAMESELRESDFQLDELR